MNTLACVLLVAVAAQAAVLKNGVVLPWYSTVCHRSDPEINECLRGSIQNLLKTISKDGIPQLGIDSLDPWTHRRRVELGLFDGVFENVTTYGLSKLQVGSVKTNFEDPQNIVLEFDFTNKKVYSEAQYRIKQDLFDNFQGPMEGNISTSISDIKGNFKIEGHMITRDGDEYLYVDAAILDIHPELGKFRATVTNNKYPELGVASSHLLNTLWQNVFINLKPQMTMAMDKVIRPRLNMAFLKVPFDQIIKE